MHGYIRISSPAADMGLSLNRTEKCFFTHILSRPVNLRPALDVYELAPRFRVVGKALHEGGIAILAGMGTAHIGIDGEI